MLTYRNDTREGLEAAERAVRNAELLVGQARAMQIQALKALDAAQVPARDGARSLADWIAAQLDVSHEAARALVTAKNLFEAHPASLIALDQGALGFERAVAMAQLAMSGADTATVERSRDVDVASVRRLIANRTRFTRRNEQQAFRDRYLALKPSLDQSTWRLYGMLPGVEGKIVEDALARRADELPSPEADMRPSLPQRNADALASIAQDSLIGSGAGQSSAPLVTIFVDEALGEETKGEKGAEIAAGPRVGPATLERMLCEGRTHVISVAAGKPVRASAAVRAIPAASRRFVIWRDGGCVVEGCSSRYRLQPHHIVPWAGGGTHEPENLATLCWYHHHVVIHRSGFSVDPASPPQRRRLLSPAAGPDPPAVAL